MTRKILLVLAVFAIALAVVAVSIEAQRGGGSRGGGSGGSGGGGMQPEPNDNININGNYNGNFPPGNYDAIDVYVFTDKRRYVLGEPIEITVTAYNPTDSTITLEFTSGTPTCQASYAIDGVERGSTVYTADMDYISLLPRGSYYWIFNTLNAPGEIVFPVAVGRHSVVGIVDGSGFYRQTDPVIVRVVE